MVEHNKSKKVFQTPAYIKKTIDSKFYIYSVIILAVVLVISSVLAIFVGWVLYVAFSLFIESRSYHFDIEYIRFYFFVGLGIEIFALGFWARFDNIKEQGKIYLEYHACEHKVIVCVANRLSPTLETLKSVPKANVNCGASILIMLATLFISLGSLGFADNVISMIGYIIFIVSFFTFFVLIILLESSVQSSNGKTIYAPLYILLLLSCPIWLLPLLLDKLVFMAEPSDEILQEGVEIAQRIYDDLGITPQTQN